jgi:hypothetical protein
VRRVPLRHHLQSWGLSDSSLCHLCHRPETIHHLSVGCPFRTHIWNVIITTYLSPSITIQDIYDTITTLHLPTETASPARYFGMVGTMLHLLWRSHWASSRHGTPVDVDQILRTFVTTIHRILSKSPPSDD